MLDAPGSLLVRPASQLMWHVLHTFIFTSIEQTWKYTSHKSLPKPISGPCYKGQLRVYTSFVKRLHGTYRKSPFRSELSQSFTDNYYHLCLSLVFVMIICSNPSHTSLLLRALCVSPPVAKKVQRSVINSSLSGVDLQVGFMDLGMYS